MRISRYTDNFSPCIKQSSRATIDRLVYVRSPSIFCCGHNVLNLPVHEHRWSAFPSVLVIVHITLTKYPITIPFQLLLASVKKKFHWKQRRCQAHRYITYTYAAENILCIWPRQKHSFQKFPTAAANDRCTILPSCSCINSFNFATVFKISSLCAAHDTILHENKTQQLRRSGKRLSKA